MSKLAITCLRVRKDTRSRVPEPLAQSGEYHVESFVVALASTLARRRGKPTIKQTAVVSADGKTLNGTRTGMDASAKPINNVVVLEK
jgi:hypothetical protein